MPTNHMSESMEDSPSIPNINLESSKGSDVYEINFNVLIAVVAVILVLVAGFLFWKFKSSKKMVEVVPTPTPTEVVTAVPTVTFTPTPTATASKELTPTLSPKQKVKIQILNGTGALGDAGFLKSKITTAGFGSIDTGNAASTSADAATSLTYYSSFPSIFKVDLIGLLNDLYASVSASTSTDSASKYDAVISTGKKK